MPPVLHTTYLGLGTNLGHRAQNLADAMEALREAIGTCLQCSQVYISAPWGLPDQPDFYNLVAVFTTALNPHQLLSEILRIEKDMGRIRKIKWGERLIDIDILFYDNEVIDSPDLSIPHPHIQDRNFVLVPMCEIARHYPHPRLQKTIEELLHDCSDLLPVQKLV